MRSYPIAASVAVAALLAGCSSESGTGPTPSASGSPATSASTSGASTSTTPTHTADPGAVGVSPNGVTTAVGAPAESTEDEYFAACHAAKTWMATQGGDLKAQFEPYLRDLQSTDSAGPGTFGTPWSALPPSRQSAVIVAAEAAADQLCG